MNSIKETKNSKKKSPQNGNTSKHYIFLEKYQGETDKYWDNYIMSFSI